MVAEARKTRREGKDDYRERGEKSKLEGQERKKKQRTFCEQVRNSSDRIAMSEQTPKLFTNKPKKKAIIAQLKHVEANFNSTVPPSSAPSPAAAAAASYMGGSAPPPPPPPPKESFARRYKYVWPLLLTVNLAVGGYLFLRTKKKDIDPVDEEMAAKSSSVAAPVTVEKPVSSTVVTEPVVIKPREPIPEKQQRELFKWMLEEKRRVTPKSSEEKKRIEEEKAILKQFIRSKTIPTL